ncbi:MAG: hypothetical protein GWN87_13205, partial [Desulfuromonadales bacterium]|nr:hypothetical protein [Desulfuromonadales bacterium]
MKRLDDEKRELQTEARLASGPKAERRKQAIEERISHIDAEHKALKASIPDEWDEKHKVYAALLKQDEAARRIYRRNVDGAYEP